MIAIPWRAKIHEVEAPDTIKISLGTGDLALAMERRDQIHVEIGDLVAFIAIYGDLPVAAVTRKTIRDFRDLLKQRRATCRKRLPGCL